MSIENMINQLQEILPSDNFKIQPQSALEELINLQDKYNVKTSDIMVKNSNTNDIPLEVQEKWINLLETFIHFGESYEKLNNKVNKKLPI